MPRAIEIDPASAAPIWLQIEEQVRRLVAAGVLAPGAPVPSVRELSRSLRINPATVAKAYQRLTDAGVLQDLTLQLGQWVPEGTTLAKVVQPGQLKAVLRIPENQAKDVSLGQKASIDTRNGLVAGHVTRKDPSAQGGSVTIDVALDVRVATARRDRK